MTGSAVWSPRRGRWGRAIVAGSIAALVAAAVPAATGQPAVHPELWPPATTRPLIDAATEARITELLAAMSVAEKVGQVIQTDIGVIEPDDLRRYPLGSVLAGADSGVHGDERAPPAAWLQLAREFRAVSTENRHGHVPIPVLFGIDAVHGHSNIVGAVLFPHNIGLGAAHDPDLARRIGVATAEEVAATGIDWTFAPVLATPQDTRWGRTYEGYAADPLLVASYAAAIVEGLQGPPGLVGGIRDGHIAATAKHFLGDGGTRDGIDQGDTEASERELVRIHAPAYRAAIDAGVLTVMASYSSWQGRKMHSSHGLLTTVLKERMGFDGFVVGDWNAHAQVPGCVRTRCAEAFNAGVDMFMAPLGWRGLFDGTLALVQSGEIPAARLEDAVRRILRVKLRLGLFDPVRPYDGRFDLVGSAAHRELAREAVRKSLVLLKNDGVLPIAAGARVLVTGPAAQELRIQAGGWTVSWQGRDTKPADFPQAQTIAAGFRDALAAGGGTLVDPLDDLATTRPEVAVVVFGEEPYAENYGDVKLPLYNARAALTLMQGLRRQGVKVVAVFLSGRPLWVNPELNASNAFVAAWLPGSEGSGIADLLLGDRSGRPRDDFNGRLPFRWPGDALGRTELFPVGYGLSYARGAPVPELDESLSGSRKAVAR